MKLYELTYLISAELSEEELKAFSQKISDFIREEGGNLNEIKNPVKKRLGQPIKNNKEVYLAILNFNLDPEKLANLEKKLKAENKILRYLISIKKVLPKIEILKKFPAKTPEVITGKTPPTPKRAPKVELKEIEKKLEEILRE